MIYSKIPKEFIPKVKPHLTYEYEIWKKTGWRNKKITKEVSLITPSGQFLSGFCDKISELTGIQFSNEEKLIALSTKLNEIILNNHQKRTVLAAIRKNRGIIKAPTGMGKTVIAAGICSAYRDYNILFLVHTTSLLTQTKHEFDRLLKTDCSVLGGGEKKFNNSNIMIATRQSAIRNIDILKDIFDIIIVDECHRVSKYKGEYWKILTTLDSVKKIGLTATLPAGKQENLIIEGLIGPMIAEISDSQGINAGRLVPVKVKLIGNQESCPETNWNKCYNWLTRNEKRNADIADIAEKAYKNKKSCLITVKNISHGDTIKERIKVPVIFLSGKESKETRQNTLEKLQNAESVVIATTIWDEGVNIPNLDIVILAGGGYADIGIIQKIGRGRRKVDGKEYLLVYDFLDRGKYLKNHSDKRIEIYKKKGWI